MGTVSTGIHTTLNTFIADDGTLNVTVHNVTAFADPTVTVVVSTDATTDDSDKISTRVIIIVGVSVAMASLLCVCSCGLLWWCTCRKPKRVVEDKVACVAENTDVVCVDLPECN